MNQSWVEYLQNPKALALKSFFAQLLQSKYPQYEELVSRLSPSLVIDKDFQQFSKLIGDVYSMGYEKASIDYQTQLQKAGIKVMINQQKKDDNQQ